MARSVFNLIFPVFFSGRVKLQFFGLHTSFHQFFSYGSCLFNVFNRNQYRPFFILSRLNILNKSVNTVIFGHKCLLCGFILALTDIMRRYFTHIKVIYFSHSFFLRASTGSTRNTENISKYVIKKLFSRYFRR